MSLFLLRQLWPIAFTVVVTLFADAAAGSASSVMAIRVSREPAATVVQIWADGDVEDVSYSHLSEPDRLAVDFPGLLNGLESDRIEVGTAQVERIRVGKHRDKIRVVIDAGDSDALAAARVVRGRQGIGIVVGSGATPNLARSPWARRADPGAPETGSGNRVPGTIVSQRAKAEGADEPSGELASAARELAAAARELTAAARELRRATGSEAPERLAAPKPPKAASTAAVREPARSEPADGSPRQQPAESRRVEEDSTQVAAVELAPTHPSTDSSGFSYAELRRWLREHAGSQPDFRPGDVLRRRDLAKARPFLAPGYWEEFDFPGIEIEIHATGDYRPHESFRASTLQYGNQTQLGDDFSLKNYVAGQPFPNERIDKASRNEAAYMVAWNMMRRWQHTGERMKGVHIAFVTPGEIAGRNPTVDQVLRGGGRVERHLAQRFQRVYLNHLAAFPEANYALDVADAKTHYYKEYMEFTDPFELRGSMFVIERSLDPYERDQVNSYLPTERRVRRLSPKERADSFVGTEYTMDDFNGFSGRVLDYDWTFLGEKTVLQVSDSENAVAKMLGPGSRVPRDRWQLRPTWVVEQSPHLEGHPYGRKVLFIDKQTYASATALVFDHEDRLLKVLVATFSWPHEGPAPTNAPPGETVPRWHASTGINKQTNIATVTWAEKTEVPEVTPSTVRRLFSVSRLTEGR